VKTLPEKVYAFIDSQNVNLGVKSQGWSLDWGKFRLLLRNKYKVEKAFLFIGYIEKYKPLYESLHRKGFILVFKNVMESKKRGIIKYKGNVDAELVLHAMIEIENYDKAIIISGDGDFFCLVEYLASKKKLRKILSPNNKYSSLLRIYSKYIVNIQGFRTQLEFSKKQKERHSRGKQC
jgi:uncharacterized LabA/DUF88 family protein